MMVHGVAPLLISAAAGYWVLTNASKVKGRIKKFGQLLGGIIIAVSLIGATCKAYYLVTCNKAFFCPPGKACPFMGGGKSTP